MIRLFGFDRRDSKVSDFLAERNIFYTVHFLIFLIGLLAFIKLSAQFLLSAHALDISINSWAFPFYFPTKKLTLIRYIFSIPCVFVYFCILYGILKSNLSPSWFRRTPNKRYIIPFFLLSLIVNILTTIPYKFVPTSYIILPYGMIWLACFLAPFYRETSTFIKNYEEQKDWNKNVFLRVVQKYDLITKVTFGLLLLAAIQFIFIFKPLIFDQLKLINEYWDIPEISLLNKQPIDNNNFINQYQFIGTHNKYDIRKPSLAQNNQCITLPISSRVKNFITKNNRFATMQIERNHFTNPFYYYHNGELCFVNLLTPFDYLHVLNLINTTNNVNFPSIAADKHFGMSQITSGFASNDTQLSKRLNQALPQYQKLNALYQEGEQLRNNYKIPASIENEFYSINAFEILWQIQNRFFIHHQNFVYGPINEINLGKKADKIFMQYGYLNTFILLKALKLFGHVNYQNYIKVSFSFYYLYYALFLMTLFIVFRKLKYVVPIFALSVAALNILKFEFLLIAPGLNPLRHFFDIFVILLFYLYTQRNKRIYLYSAILFSFVEILTNDIFGLFVFIAIIGALFVKALYQRKKIGGRLLFIVLTSALALVAFKSSNIGQHVMTKYYFQGLLSLPMHNIIFIALFFFIAAGYLATIATIKENRFVYFALFLLFYMQGILFYFVWGADRAHLLAFSLLYTFAIFAYLKLLIDHFPAIGRYKNFILDFIVLCSLVIYIPSALNFMLGKQNFEKVFTRHKTYEWNLPTAHFISTMNPKYFMDSIHLIQKYSKQNGLYIISKYDNFIPMLAHRYSEMPYFDVPWFIISYKEVNKCIQAIQKNKPKYLFVDTDIDRPYYLDILTPYTTNGELASLHKESVMRAARLNHLKEIFNAVRSNYVPTEHALLLTVYMRK